MVPLALHIVASRSIDEIESHAHKGDKEEEKEHERDNRVVEASNKDKEHVD